jgi:hypothetical protein
MKLGWQTYVVVAVAVGTGLYLSRKPWQVYRQQEVKAQETMREMREAEQERERLQIEKIKYSSPLGKEEELRKRGYGKAGETRVDDR